MKPIKLITFAGIGLIIAGIAGNIGRQIYLLKNMDYNVLGFVIRHITKTHLTVALTMSITNNSDITAEIDDYDIGVYINGMYIGQIKYSKPQIINANKTTNIIVQFDIPFKQKLNIGDMLRLTASYFGDKSKIKVKLEGQAKIKHSFFKLNVPISYDFSLDEFDDKEQIEA